MSSRSLLTLAAALAVTGVAASRIALGAPPVPSPVIDLCRCSATVFEQTSSGLTTRALTIDVTHVDDPSTPPRDTCASGSRIDITWHAQPPGVTGWQYKLDSAFFPGESFVSVPAGVRSVSYDTAPLPAGIYVFTLRAIGPKSVQETTRRFALDFAPDTWWSGPDRSSPSLQAKPNGEKYALLAAGQLASPIVGSLLSPDSTLVLPALRPERRTFFEIWKDSVFARQEGDTVHMNSWILFHGGGLDRDSPYSVRVSDDAHLLPGFPGGPVLEPGPANGSPIGFRTGYQVSLTPAGIISTFASSGLYPVFDPNDVFHTPRIGSYHPTFYAGRGFVVIQAEDGEGLRDRRVPNGFTLVTRVEDGTATPQELALRDKVLTFHIDRPPYFETTSPVFRPLLMQTFTTSQWDLHLVANDDDPFEWSTPTGGPSPNLLLRRTIKVHGKDGDGNAFTYVDPTTYLNQQDIVVNVPAALAAGPCVIEVELCDCAQCENAPGSGRCIVQNFPVIYAPGTAGSAGSGAAAASPTRLTADPATPTLLFAPYPNPASRAVTIRFSLATESAAELEVFSLAGARVRRLVSGRLAAGEHSRTWNGENAAGQRVREGIYFVRLRAAGVTFTRKVFMTR